MCERFERRHVYGSTRLRKKTMVRSSDCTCVRVRACYVLMLNERPRGKLPSHAASSQAAPVVFLSFLVHVLFGFFCGRGALVLRLGVRADTCSVLTGGKTGTCMVCAIAHGDIHTTIVSTFVQKVRAQDEVWATRW